jgi:NADH-quinone oxidoreductase subunit E
MSLEKILTKYPQKKEYLIEILLDVDEDKSNHFISEEEVITIAKHLNIKESHVCSVLSFYTLLSSKQRGKHIIQVCKDVPCYLNDDFNVVETISKHLGIEMNDTTDDKMFSLEFTACIGCCENAPAMRINNETYTNLTKDKVIKIIDDLVGGNS